MTAITVVVPSRGRPIQCALTIEAIHETALRASTKVIVAVDADDPTLPAYRDMLERLPPPRIGSERRPTLVVLQPDETGNLVKATNTVSMRVAETSPKGIIGNLGDDHRPRTKGWDSAIVKALAEPGIAYGDDLIHGERLPSAPFISASIVLALGWYALPTCWHLYIDDIWRELGNRLGALHYLPEVVIEHMHPSAGKGTWDEGYERANRRATVDHDNRAFTKWMRRYLVGDAQRVLDALAMAQE